MYANVSENALDCLWGIRILVGIHTTSMFQFGAARKVLQQVFTSFPKLCLGVHYSHRGPDTSLWKKGSSVRHPQPPLACFSIHPRYPMLECVWSENPPWTEFFTFNIKPIVGLLARARLMLGNYRGNVEHLLAGFARLLADTKFRFHSWCSAAAFL